MLGRLSWAQSTDTTSIPAEMSTVLNDAPLYTTDFADCVLLVGPTETRYHAHRHILSVQSPFFKAAFGGTFKEAETKELKLPDFDPKTFVHVLKSLYNGPFKLPKGLTQPDDRKTVEAILSAADYLQLDKLKQDISREVEIHLHNLQEEKGEATAFEVLTTLYNYGGSVDRKYMESFVNTVHSRYKSGAVSALVGRIEDPNGTLFRDLSAALFGVLQYKNR
ncbi:hypothetical protein ABW19_dt0201356 [Dactylella cylindrospora]|nr:hypothetical protein ABW19_dt0201356 [Dactylella cylindrospora]